MSEKMKIALLGVSHWHLPLYLPGPPENSIAGISDDNIDIAERYAGKYSCPAYQDYRQMVTETKSDSIFTFAPHYRIKDTAEYLLRSGTPFSMEKPAGMNAGEVESLYEFYEKKNGFCSAPFAWRCSNTINELKNKHLTKPTTHMSHRLIAGPSSRYLKTSPRILSQRTVGGGCMTNLGVHLTDMALFLTDSCSARILASVYQYSSPHDIETYAISLLKLPNGASLLLESGYVYPISEESKRENRWTIAIGNGYYIFAENRLEIREYDREPVGIPLNTSSDTYYTVYTETTLNDWLTGVKPRVSLKEMLNVNRIPDDMNAKAGL